MTDDLPDRFVAYGGGMIRTYVARVWQTEGMWFMESRVEYPLLGPTTAAAPRPVDEDHVRRMYDRYDVKEETWHEDG